MDQHHPMDTAAPPQAGLPDREARRGNPAEWILGALGCGLALFAPLAVLAAPGSEVVAVVGRPGDTAADLAGRVALAGGAILNAGGSDTVILARSDRAGFVARLYAAGAGLVLDAGTAAGCGSPVNTTSNPTGSILR